MTHCTGLGGLPKDTSYRDMETISVRALRIYGQPGHKLEVEDLVSCVQHDCPKSMVMKRVGW